MKLKALLAAAFLLAAISAQASIINTKHDLSSGNAAAGSIHTTSTNQTCVFCHAPHNAITNKLLWNRTAVAGAGMKIYTSYNTGAMRTALPQSALGNDSSSLLCLSCHSLATKTAVISNTQGGSAWVDASTTNTTFPSTTGNMTDLTNDHPVGINYDAAQTVATATGLVVSTSGTVVGAGGAVGGTGTLRLFKSAVSAVSTMECASCHSVHDNTQGKFLAVTNAQSNLCRICHVK